MFAQHIDAPLVGLGEAELTDHSDLQVKCL